MTKIPEKISLFDAANIVTLPVGIVVRDLKIKCVTGREMASTARLMKQYKIPKALFEKLYTGSDQLITRAEAAALLGVNKYCLQKPRANRVLVDTVVTVGRSPWGGPRYSLSAVQAQIAMDKIIPPPLALFRGGFRPPYRPFVVSLPRRIGKPPRGSTIQENMQPGRNEVESVS